MKELEGGSFCSWYAEHCVFFLDNQNIEKNPIVTFQFLDKLQSLQLLFQITVHL